VVDHASYVGRTVAGRFRLVALLGEGAMASVFRATQDAEPKELAIKIMHDELRDLPSFSRRFRREAKAASKLRHPNTAQVYDYGDDSEFAYISMEILSGRDLFDVMKAEKRIDPSRAVHLMKQICQALAEAQHHGIVHRDLKAENVMLVPDPNDFWGECIKVLDFGIAKIIEPAKGKIEDAVTNLTGSALTQVGSVLGTPEYMAPEQCKAEKVDFRTDVYAAGVLMYLMVTGRLPFTGELPATVMLKHVREVPEPPSRIAPEIGLQMETIILKALEKDPADRYQHANEMYWALSEIEQWMDEATVAAPSTDGRDSLAETTLPDPVQQAAPQPAPVVPLPIVPPGGLAPPSGTPLVVPHSIAPLTPHPQGPMTDMFGSSPHHVPPPPGLGRELMGAAPSSAALPLPLLGPAQVPVQVPGPVSGPVSTALPPTYTPLGPGMEPFAAQQRRSLILVFVGTLIAVGTLTAIVLLAVL